LLKKVKVPNGRDVKKSKLKKKNFEKIEKK